MVIMSKTFRMIKEALIKASVPITFMVLFLIIGLAPLYVMYGLIDRATIQQKTSNFTKVKNIT